MASGRYAKDQPEGFVNRIERVAIVGAGGTIGKSFTEELLATGKHTITAITRVDSNSNLPEGVKRAPVDFNNKKAIADILNAENIQFLIISLAIGVPPEIHENFVEAAAIAGVPLVMPNAYGMAMPKEEYRNFREEFQIGELIMGYLKDIEHNKVSKWVVLECGPWYEICLALELNVGFNFAEKKVTFFDDATHRWRPTTLKRNGEAVAHLASLPWLPEDENDSRPTVSKYYNNLVVVQSFYVTQREILDSVHRVLGDSDADWKIEYQNTKERWEYGQKLLAEGNYAGRYVSMLARDFFPDTTAMDLEYFEAGETNRKILGLEQESLDEATKLAISLANTPGSTKYT